MASKRRLARAGGAAVRAGLPPVELRSRFDGLWSDPLAVQELATRYRLALEVDSEWKAWKCFDAFRLAWCEANGLASKFPGHFERAAAEALGIDVSGSARYRLSSMF